MMACELSTCIRRNWWSVFAMVLLLGAVLTMPVPPAQAGEPCCQITAINAQTGIVTAVDKATGKTFQFQVKNAALLRSFQVGQRVWVDSKNHWIGVQAVGGFRSPGVAPTDGIRWLGAAPVDGIKFLP